MVKLDVLNVIIYLQEERRGLKMNNFTKDQQCKQCGVHNDPGSVVMGCNCSCHDSTSGVCFDN